MSAELNELAERVRTHAPLMAQFGEERLTAYQMGERTFSAGHPITRNPFVKGCHDHNAWVAAWHQAEDEEEAFRRGVRLG